MLFNSYFFIFTFLPLTLFLFFFTAKFSKQLSLSILLLASFIFYIWVDYHYGLILLSSIAINFFISKNIIESYSDKIKKYLLCLGIIFNLGLLAYFKYINFLIDSINTATPLKLDFIHVILPIGISFYTFTQIAFLTDSYRGFVKKYNLLNYALFVTYFPHLIAGPIIHHREVMPQFEKSTIFKINSRNILLGLTIFAIGLFKKVVLADYLNYFVVPIFDTHASQLSASDAWIGALAYSFELYFDFSGYCDMAIGLSLLFNIKLPVNFNSPYQSTNIIEFWRRWNMTLSRFLRDYLYIPLGGNRKGPLKRYVNLIITMLLGGLWHGANWTFVVWGLLHGIYLCINHAWIYIKNILGISMENKQIILCLKYASRLLTFTAVVIAWVFFRSPDFATAFQILDAMFFQLTFIMPIVLKFFSLQKMMLILLVSFMTSWILPNSYQLLIRFKPGLIQKNQINIGIITWKPTLLWNSIISILFVLAICLIQSSNVFLYFKF